MSVCVIESLPVLLCHCCLRCTECHSTLLPGSYKIGTGLDSGLLVCSNHLSRHALASQNGRPDLSKKPPAVQSARVGRSAGPPPSPCHREQSETPTVASPANDTSTNNSGGVGTEEIHGSGETEENARPSSTPPNPFDESDEEDVEKKTEDSQTPANGVCPLTPDSHPEGTSRPVPAPRRVSEPTPPPRPAPRVRLPHMSDGLIDG